MVEALKKNPKFKGRRGPLILAILDGIGYGKYEDGDAVKASRMKWLDKLTSLSPHTKLKAHGMAVGLPSDDDMGNSEVGHNAIGAGRVFAQGAKLVNKSIETGQIFETEQWQTIINRQKRRRRAFYWAALRRQCSFAHQTIICVN